MKTIEAEYKHTGLIQIQNREQLYTMEYCCDHDEIKDAKFEGWLNGFDDGEVIVVINSVYDDAGNLCGFVVLDCVDI